MIQTWAEIVWCHWRVPMSAMDGRFPPGVRAQEHDGSAGVVRAAGYPVTDEPDVVTAGEAVQVKVGLPRLL